MMKPHLGSLIYVWIMYVVSLFQVSRLLDLCSYMGPKMTYSTNHPQLKQYMHVTRMSFLDSTCMYTHTRYLHTSIFTCVHACMATVTS